MTPERLAFINRILDHRQSDLTLVNDGIHKQQNLSAIIRSCDAFGVGKLHRVHDINSARTFKGTAMGSQKWVEVLTYDDISTPLKTMHSDGYQIVAAHLTADAVDFREIDYTKPTAIVMGHEKRGVSEAALAHVDQCITIPMFGAVESFNVSVAAAIILSEAQRQRSSKGMYDQRQLSAEDCERLMFEITQPALVDYCVKQGLNYPKLDEHGELLEPQKWIESVRKGS